MEEWEAQADGLKVGLLRSDALWVAHPYAGHKYLVAKRRDQSFADSGKGWGRDA